jgi:sulfur relay (sulfurtransferase) DsrC/TusE family protein
VIDYIRSFRQSASAAPSRADVCAGLSMTRKQFYELFPGTLKTALRVAGLPAPKDAA